MGTMSMARSEREQRRVLVVEDEALMRSFLEQALRRMGYAIQVEPSGERALEAAKRSVPDLALMDIRLGGMDGIELLGRLRELAPECACIMMTAHGSVETAIAAMRAGASDFLLKPFTVDALEVVLDKALGISRLKSENRRLRDRLRRRRQSPVLIGQSASMARLRETLRTIARSPATVLIEGESGTGKELVSQALHLWGPRSRAPFVKVNCAALPAGLLESELFGHERGAFTGATASLKGKFELAAGGSLLLDEISEMELALQPKLLRSIQEKEFYRVGGHAPLKVDVRIIATTNANLSRRVETGQFREDLYYRLRVVPVRIPPLRERREDIPLLAQHFLKAAARENEKHVERISAEALAQLMQPAWPGNVRELENMIHRAVVISPDPVIRPEHLLWDAGCAEIAGANPAGDLSQLPDFTLREMERLWILRALERDGGNKSRAARRLGISVRTIRNKLHTYETGVSA